jgi:hypothetical protein
MMVIKTMNEKVYVPFVNNRIFITFTLFLMLGLPSSFIPEETYPKWLLINFIIALLLTVVNYMIWTKQKHDSKRYFSLHSFVMMLGLAFYATSPILRLIYHSMYFWILLGGLILYTVFLLSKYDAIAGGLLNPRKKGFKLLVFSFFAIVFVAGSSIWGYMLASDAAPVNGVAIILFFLGLFLLMVAPSMLVTPERADELTSPQHN